LRADILIGQNKLDEAIAALKQAIAVPRGMRSSTAVWGGCTCRNANFRMQSAN